MNLGNAIKGDSRCEGPSENGTLFTCEAVRGRHRSFLSPFLSFPRTSSPQSLPVPALSGLPFLPHLTSEEQGPWVSPGFEPADVSNYNSKMVGKVPPEPRERTPEEGQGRPGKGLGV